MAAAATLAMHAPNEAAEPRLMAAQVQAPAAASGLLWFLQLAPGVFVALNLLLVVVGLAAGLQGAPCSLSPGWLLLLGLELAYCAGLALLQLRVRQRLQVAAEGVLLQRARLRPLAAQLEGPQGGKASAPRPWRWWGSRDLPHGAGAEAQDEASGCYYLPSRNETPCHFALLHSHYGEYLDSAYCSCTICADSLAGMLQVFATGAAALQPGLLRMCYRSQEETVFLELVHQAWVSLTVMSVIGILQLLDFRWLLKNALHTAAGEREWLAHDLLKGEHKEISFLASIDNLERSALDCMLPQPCAPVRGYKTLAQSTAGSSGRLNLTHAWMCASSAAETFGANYTARMCHDVATQTRQMIEGSSNYKFKLRSVAAWDTCKVGNVSQVVQAFSLVLSSAELLGASDDQSIWVFATSGILLGVHMATWRTMSAARYFDDEDIEQGGRLLEVIAAVGSMAILTSLIWLWAVFCFYFRFGTCFDGAFSVLNSLVARQTICEPPTR